MKYEWNKEEKELYGIKETPKMLKVPEEKVIMINGEGNPNEEDFSNRVSALYSVAYGIKMSFKKLNIEELEYKDFTVFPLTGIWQIDDGEVFDKSKLKYTIMIKQPDFITEEFYKKTIEDVKKKKPNDLYDEISFNINYPSKVITALHIGSYDNESITFAKMEEYAKKMNLERINKIHTEIYLSDKNRTSEEKLKTILRFEVK